MSERPPDPWETMSTSSTMRRSTDEPVDEATQNLLLAARAPGLGACLTSWASYGGEPLRRDAAGVPPATRGWNQPDVEDP